jgi:uncharacterized protein (DUF486 family)
VRTALVVVGLLVASNAFMTVAWYGHLKFKDKALLAVILVSWLIALPEYALQVPANRIGHSGGFSATQLKIIQEVVSLTVFVLFVWAYLGERPTWRTALAFTLVAAAVALVASRPAGKPPAPIVSPGEPATRPESAACPAAAAPPLPGTSPSAGG